MSDSSILYMVMTSTEAAQEFGITTAAVRMAIRRGRLPARKAGPRPNDPHLILREDAERLWKRHVA